MHFFGFEENFKYTIGICVYVMTTENLTNLVNKEWILCSSFKLMEIIKIITLYCLLTKEDRTQNLLGPVVK